MKTLLQLLVLSLGISLEAAVIYPPGSGGPGGANTNVAIIAGTGVTIATNTPGSVYTVSSTAGGTVITNFATTNTSSGLTNVVRNIAIGTTNGVAGGIIEFQSPASVFGAGAGNSLFMQNNVPGSFSPYQSVWREIALTNGFTWLGNDSTTWLSLGMDPSTLNIESILRAAPKKGKLLANALDGDAVGASVSDYMPENGGSGAALSALPQTGEIWKRLPIPPIHIITDGIYAIPYTNGDTEAFVTNSCNSWKASGMTARFTNYAIPVWIESEEWMSRTRDGSGNLQFNSQFPGGSTYLMNYLRTNDMWWYPHIDWTANPGGATTGIFPGTYAAMNPYTCRKDVAYFYGLGRVAAIRLADGQATNTSGTTYADTQWGAGFTAQMQNRVGYELLYPNGGIPEVSGYSNLICLDTAIQTAYAVNISLNYPFTIDPACARRVNTMWDDYGRKSNPAGTAACDKPSYQMDITDRDLAGLGGPGHYFSHVYADNLGVSVTDTRCHLSAQCMYPGPLTWWGSNVDTTFAASFTNVNFLAAFAEPGQQQSFKASYTTNVSSVRVKPIAGGGYYVLMVNQTAGTLTMSLDWSQMVSPAGFVPVGSTLYPVKVDTNQWFSVFDIWGGTNYGSYQGTMSRDVTTHNFAFFKFTPTLPFRMAYNDAGQVLSMTNQFLTRGGAGGIGTYQRDDATTYTEWLGSGNKLRVYSSTDGATDCVLMDVFAPHNWTFPAAVIANVSQITNASVATTVGVGATNVFQVDTVPVKKAFQIDTNGNTYVNGVTRLTGNLLFPTDNTYDIGAGGATRPRNIYAGGTATFGSSVQTGNGGEFYWASRSTIGSPSDGVIVLRNNADTDFSRLQFGGTTASFPSIKRNAAGIDFRLADDSAAASITAQVVTATNGFASYRSNLVAPTSITFPATTVNFTNPLAVNVQFYIDNAAITGTAVKKNGATIFGTLPGAVTLILQPGEYFSETYTIGTPSATYSPF